MAQRWPWPDRGGANVVLQWGPERQDTLLLATCAAAERQPIRRYVSLARLRGQVSAALEGLGTPDLVAVDEVDAVAGLREDEVALFNLHNRVRDAGASLVYAGRHTPAALGLELADLGSRLAQCTLVALPTLDDAGRAEVLRRRAASRGLAFDEAAITGC